MRLITKYDVFIPETEVREAVFSKESTLERIEAILTLLRTAFSLGRDAERKAMIEEATAKEGGIVNEANPNLQLVHPR